MFLAFICLHTLTITEYNCPLAIRLDKRDEFHVNVPKYFPVSFANWGDDVEIEIESSKTYGPYNNKKRVFGIYFGEYNATIKIMSDAESQIVFGCLKNNSESDLHRPGDYSWPVGSYEREYKNTDYPILFTDDQGLSGVYTKGVITIICLIFVAICYFMMKNGMCDISKIIDNCICC